VNKALESTERATMDSGDRRIGTVSGPFASDFSSLEDGWVIDGNVIYATKDAGQHWSKITSNIELTRIIDLTLISPSVGFVTTFVPARDKTSKDAWKLYKTTDGGHNWFELRLLP
jgi:photosystem II stability/assembly factor-like uncharacterized protein